MVIDGASRRASSSSRSRAALRETEGLAASLLRDRSEVLRWKDENPLRLVAAALVDVERGEMKRGRASKKNLADKLVSVAIAPEDWDNWWKVVQPALRDSQDFDYDQRGGTKPSRTAPSEIAPVTLDELSASSRKTRAPADSVSKSSTSSARLIEWITWTQSDVPLPIPRGTPPSDLSDYLRQQPAALVPTAVDRLRKGVEDRILNAGQPPKTSGVWIESLSTALSRWVETTNPPETSVAEIVTLAMRLSVVLEPRDSYSLIKWLLPSVSESAKASSPSLESIAEVVGVAARLDDSGSLIKWFVAYMSESVKNSAVMANAILINLRRTPRETASLLQNLHDSLGGPARKDLWRRLITSDSGQINDWLNNRWRTIPTANEKAEVATSLIMASQDSDLMGNLDALLSGEWDFADGEQRQHLFNPILFGWFMHSELMPGCRRVLRELAEQVGKNGATPRESAASATVSLMPYFEEFIAIAARDRLKRQGDDYENRLAVERDRLRDAEAELERAGKRERHLQGELRDAAFVKGLRFNRDAIIILGQSLQGLATSQIASHQDVEDVKDKITFALAKLGAKPFGEVGKIVPFEPGVHETRPTPVAGVPVKITGPGVEYFKDVDTPQMMIKIPVQVEDPG